MSRLSRFHGIVIPATLLANNASEYSGYYLLFMLLSENTGKDIEVIGIDTDHDNYMDATQAVNYGLVDKIDR